MKKTNRPMFFAALLMGLLLLLGATTAQAQEANTLVTTTGPNVLEQGNIQWNSQMEYLHYTISHVDFSNHQFSDINTNSLGLASGFRFGIGSKAELTFDLSGGFSIIDTTIYKRNSSFNVVPSIGAKLLLYEGQGWLPKTAFFTRITVPFAQRLYRDQWDVGLNPQIGLQFRNRIGNRFLLDYSLGYDIPNLTEFSDLVDADYAKYSLFLRWLATDRMMLGLGLSNLNELNENCADFEVRYQANNRLQLNLQASCQLGANDWGISSQIHALVGISWMLK